MQTTFHFDQSLGVCVLISVSCNGAAGRYQNKVETPLSNVRKWSFERFHICHTGADPLKWNMSSNCLIPVTQGPTRLPTHLPNHQSTCEPSDKHHSANTSLGWHPPARFSLSASKADSTAQTAFYRHAIGVCWE